jgi:hypothetical protein
MYSAVSATAPEPADDISGTLFGQALLAKRVKI